MNQLPKSPIYRDDDNELLGFVTGSGTSWEAQTIFGLMIERTVSREAAVQVLRDQGLSYLMGTWQYFDKDDQEWHSCVLKEAREHQVTVIRTTPLGYQDPDDYKMITIENPTETDLIKG